MTDVREQAGELIESDQAFEEGFRELLEVDAEGAWEFQDISLGSGRFGEIVSRGIVEKTEDGYRIADRAALEAALEGEEYEPTAETESGSRFEALVPSIDRRWAVLLAVGLLVTLLVRTVFVWGYVFKNGDVVLLKNDPWFYRYWTETLLNSGLQAGNIGDLGKLPNGVTGGNEVLLIVTLWWATAAIGGTAHDAGTVIAWYPVVSGLLSMVMIYLIGTRVGKDKRVGLAAVLLGAFFGIFAQRTALGYGDHHAFDFFWLTLGLFAITIIVDELPSGNSWNDVVPGVKNLALPILALGIAIGGQIAAWPAGAILVLPIGGVAFFAVLGAIRRDWSPAIANVPLLVGTAIGALIPFLLDSGFDWLSPDRVLAPAVLFAGVLAVTVIGELGYRADLSMNVVTGIEIAVMVSGFAVIWFLVPDLAGAFQDMIGYFQRLSGAQISETIPLLGPRAGLFMGPIYHFGFVFYLIIPYVGWGIWTVWQDDQPLVQVPTAMYTGFFIVFSLIQFRFAFALALGTSVFGGLALVHLGTQFDLTTPPNVFLKRSVENWRQSGEWEIMDRIEVPSLRDGALLLLVFAFLLNFALLTIPLGFSDFAVTDETYETAKWIEADSQQRGLEYPQNYVFTPWSQNRLYNYFASGESRSYSYAQSNYEEFMGSTEPETWYDRLRNRPVGYILTTDDYSGEPTTMFSRLHDRHGSGTEEVAGLSHYRAVHVSESESRKVFTLVPGATIEGVGPANSSTTVETSVTVGNSSFTYERWVETGSDGQYSLTVPYPGEYSVFNETYSVNETAVQDGLTIG